jgi:hypothetical protein
MRTQYFFIAILGLIIFSCSSSKKSTNTSISTQISNIQIVETDSEQINNWLDQPNSSSSKIKVLNAAIAFGSLPNGLNQMGYTITENTGSFLSTNAIRAISEDVKVKAWIEGSDIVLTSEIQQYTETEFGLPQASGLTLCAKGNSTSFPDCWRTILIIANHLGNDKKYQ